MALQRANAEALLASLGDQAAADEDEEQEADRYAKLAPEGIPLVAVNIALELELEQMDEVHKILPR